LGYGVDEARRRGNGGGRLGVGNWRGRGADGIVGPRLELIGGAEEGHEVALDTRLVPRQPGKFATDASVRLRQLAALLEDVSLGGVECRKVRFAGGDMGKGNAAIFWASASVARAFAR
jgi:hypothetical protein